MRLFLIFFSLITVLLVNCTPEKSKSRTGNTIVYDIFPVIGQSNAYNGYGLDYTLDKTDSRIKQLGRFDSTDHLVIPAVEPLDFVQKATGCNSFAMTFSLQYLQNYWEAGREILLIPAAENGSSFRFKQWNKGDTLYNDAVERIKYVLKKYPGSEVKAFLWHQGESDVYWGRDYATKLDLMITAMRREIAGTKGDSIPFIVGGLVPYWTDQANERKIIDSVIRETPGRLPRIGYVSTREPFEIIKPDNTVNIIHFDAAGQRELGRRYFAAYQLLRK